MTVYRRLSLLCFLLFVGSIAFTACHKKKKGAPSLPADNAPPPVSYDLQGSLTPAPAARIIPIAESDAAVRFYDPRSHW